MLDVHDAQAHELRSFDVNAPSLYDEYLRLLAGRCFAAPPEVEERDWSQPYEASTAVTEIFEGIYAEPQSCWAEHETAEELLDVQDLFQQWRFRT